MRGRCGRGEPSGSGLGPASRAPAVSERGGSPGPRRRRAESDGRRAPLRPELRECRLSDRSLLTRPGCRPPPRPPEDLNSQGWRLAPRFPASRVDAVDEARAFCPWTATGGVASDPRHQM